jgi:hypothetical protein
VPAHEALDVPVGDILDDHESANRVAELVLQRRQVVDDTPILSVVAIDVVELENIDLLRDLLLLLAVLVLLFALLLRVHSVKCN